jgi:hypothetical protein
MSEGFGTANNWGVIVVINTAFHRSALSLTRPTKNWSPVSTTALTTKHSISYSKNSADSNPHLKRLLYPFDQGAQKELFDEKSRGRKSRDRASLKI